METRRASGRRASRDVPLVAGGLLGSAVLMFSAAGCTQGGNERCVDTRSSTVIADRYCENTSTSTSYAHWYYGGTGLRIGDKVSGGEIGEHGVARGGFGRGGAGEGDGGEGGHGSGS